MTASKTFDHRRPRIKRLRWVRLTIVLCFMVLSSITVTAQTSSFTYQGRLTDGGTAANGNYDLQFALWDSANGGTQIGSTLTVNTVAVSNGVFSISLDFGAGNFTGANRFLEINVRPSGSGPFTTLVPRQPVTSTPYSIRTLNATTADGLSNACVACVQDSQINQLAGSKVNGAIPFASVPNLGANYIQNSTTQQAASNFNISGNGAVGGTVSAGQYNIFNQGVNTPVLSVSGIAELGQSNTFVGVLAGNNNTPDINGHGSENSFFGKFAGSNNTNGFENTFVGYSAGLSNDGGAKNTLIGHFAQVLSPNLFNATAIGANAAVSQSNSLVLGSTSGVNGGTDTMVGIGTPAPTAKLDVAGNALVRGAGTIANNPNAAELQVGYGLANAGTAGSVARLALQPYGYQTGPWRFVARDDATTAYLDWVYGASLTGITQDSNGNVGIGASTPATKLQVRGDIRVGLSALNGGCVQRFDGTAIAGACSSDARFKRDITPFPNLLNKLTQLRPVNYYWRSAAFPEKHFGSSQSYGLVAQEVQRVLPELVGEDERGYKTVDYSKLPLMLLQAVKELKAENDSLRQQNTQIGAKLKQIERTIHRRRRPGADRSQRPR